MKGFFLGAVITFLACSGIVHRRLTYFWIDYFQFSIPVEGDLYQPARGTIELVIAALLLVIAVATIVQRRFHMGGKRTSYPPRHFPTPS